MLLALANRWRGVRWRFGLAKRRLLVLLIVVLALAIFAPSIVLHTPLRERVLTTAISPEVGRLTVGSLTAGWLTPVTATDVTLYDVEGNRLADIKRLSIDRTVIGLLADSRDLGTIRLEGATLYALVRPDGSNLEDTIAKQANSKPSEDKLSVSGGGPSYTLEIVDGRLLSRSTTTGETWSADSLSATIRHPVGAPLRIEAAGVLRPARSDNGLANDEPTTTAGRFELRWGGDDNGQLDGMRFVCQDLQLAALEPWLQRSDSRLRVTGLLTGEISAAYPVDKYDSLSGDTTGRISLTQFAVTGSALAGEPLRLDDTNLAWRCSASGGSVSIENLSLNSDLAMFDLRGRLNERTLQQVLVGAAGPYAIVASGDLEAEGRLNLARLAQRLPGLLNVREGTTITSGQVRFNARSVTQNGGHQITASLTTSPITGSNRGRAIEWDTPLDVNLVAKYANNAWRFDRIACQSQFLNVSGSGDARQMQLSGSVDLDELASRLDQFVDLTNWQLAGRGEIAAKCLRDQTGQFTADASGTLTDFVVAHGGDELVTEPMLEWSSRLEGSTLEGSLWPNRLSRGRLSMTAAGDELAIQLVQPTVLESTWAATDWPLSITTVGRLDGWSRRLRPWVNLSAWQMAGALELSLRGRVKATPLVVNIAESQLQVDGLRAVTSDWLIDEPRVQWSGDIAWDSTTNTVVSRAGKLVSSSVAASFRDWYWTADPKQTGRVGGLAAVRVNLGRLARAQRMPHGEPHRMLPVGEMSGQVKLAEQAGQVVAAVDISGQNIQLQTAQPGLPGVTPTMTTIWQEPMLRVVGTLGYAPSIDRLTFDGLQTQSATLALAASGSVDRLNTERLINVAGTVDYDLASLTPILAQYVGQGLTIAGREQARFELKGSLNDLGGGQIISRPPHGTGHVAAAQVSVSQTPSWYARFLAPWQSASLYGLPIGPGRISAELNKGQVTIEPLDFAVGGGRLTAAPSIQLEPAPGQLTLPPGPLLTNIRITPDVSQRMLKYINPFVASAVQTEGVFSMSLSGGTVPLGAPATSDVAGKLDLQSMRVVPGPALGELSRLVQEIARLTKGNPLFGGGQGQPVTLLSFSDRTIDFRLVDGRVYHQGLEFEVEKRVFRSRGSVGLDNSVSVMLEVQIPPEGILRNVGVTRLDVPITGSLSNMKIDSSAALSSLKQQVGGQLLNEETIGNALDKLFGGGR